MKQQLKRLTIRVDSGIITVLRLPKGVELEVRDYDIDNDDESNPRIRKDKDGGHFERSVISK